MTKTQGPFADTRVQTAEDACPAILPGIWGDDDEVKDVAPTRSGGRLSGFYSPGDGAGVQWSCRANFPIVVAPYMFSGTVCRAMTGGVMRHRRGK